jgi:hypothetical protein
MMVRRGGEYYCAIFLVSNQINFRFFIFSRQQAVVHGLYIRRREKGVGIPIYAVIRIINKINTFFRAYLLALTLG